MPATVTGIAHGPCGKRFPRGPPCAAHSRSARARTAVAAATAGRNADTTAAGRREGAVAAATSGGNAVAAATSGGDAVAAATDRRLVAQVIADALRLRRAGGAVDHTER